MRARTTAGLLGVPAMIPHERETARLQAFSRFVALLRRLHPAPETLWGGIPAHFFRSRLCLPASPTRSASRGVGEATRRWEVGVRVADVGSWHMGAQGADDGDEVEVLGSRAGRSMSSSLSADSAGLNRRGSRSSARGGVFGGLGARGRGKC